VEPLGAVARRGFVGRAGYEPLRAVHDSSTPGDTQAPVQGHHSGRTSAGGLGSSKIRPSRGWRYEKPSYAKSLTTHTKRCNRRDRARPERAWVGDGSEGRPSARASQSAYRCQRLLTSTA
jgi:hypothetical protein